MTAAGLRQTAALGKLITGMPKKLIFVCVGNSCRSQMAEGFARHYAQKLNLNIEIASAGSRPAGYVHPDAIAIMREKGIDISQQYSKGVTPQELLSYDYLITMGCSNESICPATFRGDSRDWGIPDPIGRPIDFYRKVRDEIEQKVLELLQEMAQC